MYKTPTLSDGSLYSFVITGRKAASVLPDAVGVAMRRLESVLNITSQAATCISLSSSQPFL